MEGLPGDPLTSHNPFSVHSYLFRTASLLRTLLSACQTRRHPNAENEKRQDERVFSFPQGGGPFWTPSLETITETIGRLLKYGLLTAGGLVHAVGLLEAMLTTFSRYPENLILQLLDAIRTNARQQLEALTDTDDELRRLWEVIDLALTIMVGMIRFGLLSDPRGFDVINDYECREWLRLNGASDRSLNSALIRGLYDLAFAYEDGDFQRPRLAAGQALRGSLRMFFTSRGALFWKMRAGMGDVSCPILRSFEKTRRFLSVLPPLRERETGRCHSAGSRGTPLRSGLGIRRAS